MRNRRHVIAVTSVAVLLGAAVATYAYDASRRDVIAAGIEVGGVDVGGMEEREARATLARELVARLREPVVATYGGRRFALSPRRVGVVVDVGAMVAAALARGREDWLLARVGRELTGGSVDVDVRPRLSFDATAVDRFVARVAARLDRPPRDARLIYQDGSLDAVDGRRGVAVDRGRLRRAVVRALRQVDEARTVRVRARTRTPNVTRARLARRNPVVVTVDRARFTLTLWKRLRRAASYTVAIGQVGLDTPAGLYHIQNKAVDPVWSVPNSAWAGDLAGQQIPPGPSNPIKARWLGIFDGAGIHGTDDVASLGTAASHGCVRMAVPDVIELYDEVPVGAPIYIA